MNKEALQKLIEECEITPSEVAKMSYGLISLNQAQQWVDFYKNERNLSSPVMVMLAKMCEQKKRGMAKMDGPLTVDRILSMSASKDKVIVCGIYFLIKNDTIVYIGQSTSTYSRITAHCKEKDFDRIFILEVSPSELNVTEREYIDRFNPILNTSHRTKPDPPKEVKYFAASMVSIRFGEDSVVCDAGNFWYYEYGGSGWKVPKSMPKRGKYLFGEEVVSTMDFKSK